MLALALGVLLAQLVSCPPDVGQIRWSGFSYSFSAQGERQTVEGSLWDRDRNGKPSKGDLFRVDGSERWFVLGGGLAGGFAARFKQIGASLTASCESRFEVSEVPVVNSPEALADLLDEGSAQVNPVQRINSLMRGWADELCNQKKHYEEDQLVEVLVRRAEQNEKGFKNSTLRREARAVAKDYGLKCAHLDVPKVTFD